MSSVEQVINKDFYNKLKDACNLVKNEETLRIIAHYDGDGTSSAIILMKALLRIGKRVHVSFIKSLLGEDFRNMIMEYPDLATIAVDAGSEQVQYVPEHEKIVVLDHHFYRPSPARALNINARDFGIDGTRGACGASMAMVFALTLDEKNADLIPFFVAGLISDKQDLGGISGLNKMILDEYQSQYSLVRTTSFEGETLLDALTYSTDPFYLNITGKPENARALLVECRLDPDVNPSEINEDQRRILEKKLAARLIAQGCGLEAIRYMESDMMRFRGIDFNSKELASLIDGSARVGKNSVAVQYFLGDHTVYEELVNGWKSYKTKLIDYVYRSMKEVVKLSDVQFFYAPEAEMAGKISDLLMLYLVDQSKPVIGFNAGDDITKVSSRGTTKMVQKGLNLSIVMRNACEAVEGSGGGHDVAAGGTVPKGKEKEFIELVNRILKESFSQQKSVEKDNNQ